MKEESLKPTKRLQGFNLTVMDRTQIKFLTRKSSKFFPLAQANFIERTIISIMFVFFLSV